jgi:hypothetical protein
MFESNPPAPSSRKPLPSLDSAPPLAILLLAVCAGLLAITGQKLYHMSQLRGWIPGRIVETHVITDRWEQVYRPVTGPFGDIRHAYWVSWGTGSIRVPGPDRVDLDPLYWASLKPGDSMQILRLPGDPDAYSLMNPYATDGSFLFDGALLLAELFGIGRACVSLIRYVRRGRETEDDAAE